jgi:nucleoside-diphosphate-sugar epimerase
LPAREVRRSTGGDRPDRPRWSRDTDILEFFKMAAAGWLLLPSGERFVTVAFVGDVVRAILASAVAEPGRVFHLGEPEPYRMDELLRLVASSGGVKARMVRVPAPLVRAAGAAGSLHSLGARRW